MPNSDRAPGLTLTWLSGQNFNALTLDVSKSERHTFEADVTDSPVEEGIDATDNVRMKSNLLQVEGILTDFPLSLRGGGIGEAGYAGRAAALFAKLEALQAAGTRFGVDTGLKFYQGMVIQAMVPLRDKTSRGALRISFSFKTIRTVQTANVPLPKERKGEEKKTKGKQPTEAAGAEIKKSWLTIGDDAGPQVSTGYKKTIPPVTK